MDPISCGCGLQNRRVDGNTTLNRSSKNYHTENMWVVKMVMKMPLELGPGFKEFYRTNKGQMPFLIAEGFDPMSVATLMQRRLDVLGTSLQDVFWTNYFDTGDAIVYGPYGKIKVVLDAEAPRVMTRTSGLSDGALVLPKGAYESLDAIAEFRR